MKTMTLTPAFGDYKTATAASDSFNGNRDWILNDFSSPWDGKPINKEQIDVGTSVILRFNKCRKTTMLKVTK